jgi:DNA excision repair protein ERCC-4
MNIIADDRERPSGIVELLEKSGATVTVKRLLYGDYLIDGKLVVERKTANDFVISIFYGRLFKQIRELKKIRWRVVLMIEGDPYQTVHGIRPKAVRGALTSVSAVWQVPVIFSSSVEDTAKQLQVMADQMKVCQDVVPLRGGYRPKRLKNRQLFIIQGLPGVGPKLAWRLLFHFRNVSGVFSAGIDDLTKIDGIGNVLANQIREVLDVRINTALSS